jgi:hypothetical protein
MSLDSRSARAWVAAVVVVLAALFGIAYLLVAPESRKPLDDYVAAVKAAGKPVTVEEVIGPPPPPETNGIVDFDAAYKWLDEHAGPTEKWTYAGPWSANWTATWYDDEPPERLAALDRYLESLQPFFDGLAAAVAKPRFVVPASRTAQGFVVEPGAQRLLDAIRVVQARAFGASRAQDRLDSVALLLMLSSRIDGPSSMDHIVANAASHWAVLALRRDLERGAVDAAPARAKLDALLVGPWPPRVSEMVTYQRVLMLDFAMHADFDARPGGGMFSSLALDVGKRIERALRGQPEPPAPAFRGTPKEFVAAHAAFAPLESLPTDSYPRIMNEVRAFWDATKDAPFVHGWMPASPGVVESFARTAAGARLARVALAVAAHRDFPPSLDELRPMFPDGVPLDPFTDAPFIYEKTATGARVASLGRLSEDEPLADPTLRERCLVWELKR